MALAAYRSSVHSSTNFSRHCLILGQEVCALLHVAMGLPPSERRVPSDYVTVDLEIQRPPQETLEEGK